MTDNDVVFVSEEQDLAARDEALAEIGLSWEELREEAAAGSFSSERARALWDTFGELTAGE